MPRTPLLTRISLSLSLSLFLSLSLSLSLSFPHAYPRRCHSRWYYLILDEAHYIKNFQSQRWQTLLHFNTVRRLLLTGTPLQNSLMELWSLMHFLMPEIFRSRKEFQTWFSNPLTSAVEGKANLNRSLVARLHGIIRPFILRRLKADVASQLPGKFEHIVRCELSRRQRFLYEEFMSRSSTRAALSGGSVISMLGVLMQLRKVCNHPDLFAERVIASPLVTPSLSITVPRCVASVLANNVHARARGVHTAAAEGGHFAVQFAVKPEPRASSAAGLALPAAGGALPGFVLRREPKRYAAASFDFVRHNLHLVECESSLCLGAYDAQRRVELCASSALIEELGATPLEERVLERAAMEDEALASGGGLTTRTYFPITPPWWDAPAAVAAAATPTLLERGRGARGSGATFAFALDRNRIFHAERSAPLGAADEAASAALVTRSERAIAQRHDAACEGRMRHLAAVNAQRCAAAPLMGWDVRKAVDISIRGVAKFYDPQHGYDASARVRPGELAARRSASAACAGGRRFMWAAEHNASAAAAPEASAGVAAAVAPFGCGGRVLRGDCLAWLWSEPLAGELILCTVATLRPNPS